jgi:hypothetical protein
MYRNNQMNHKFKVSIPLAIVITLVAVIYQRSTGPTYPKKFDIGLEEQVTIKFPRSHGGTTDAPVEVPMITEDMTATMTYKRYPTKDEWTTVELVKDGNFLKSKLPNQPPAGKLNYFLNLSYGGKTQQLASAEDPIFIRYKGEVPTAILAPHVFCMFLSMLLSVVALFEALYGTKKYKLIGRITLGCLMVGGMILGPIVQKYAFGVYWAGFPYDWDLTDNKLLIGVLSWLFAVALTWKGNKKWPTIMAAIILFAVYSIPHSMQGSEFDYEKGKVITDLD